MERYIVKQEDLIGQIKGFPIEVVQRMVDCQVEQGNKADVTVFQRYKFASTAMGGFDWRITKEREPFWCYVMAGIFDEFFEIYPKPNKKVYYRGDKKRGDEIIKALEELGGKNERTLQGFDHNRFYFIGENDTILPIDYDSTAVYLLQQNYTEMHLPEQPKETIKIGEDIYEVTEELKVALKNLKKENIYKPRVGDYVTILLADTPIKAIIVGISDSIDLTYIRVSADNGYDVNECCTTLAKINPATPEEKQEIDTILSYWDVMWNPTKYKLEQKRWRAEKLGVYYYITRGGKVSKTIEGNYSWNNEDYQFGNYFRTEPQAKDKAEQIKKLFQ
jgi:hypothetical protein